MNDQIEKYLVDISLALESIDTFIIDTDSYDKYLNDSKTKSAVERQLIIIGEAINKIRKIDSSISITSAKEIVLFRNRVVHAYDSIEDSIVWAILKNHLPILKEEINSLLT